MISPIHRWEPRSKLVGFGVLVFAVAWVEDLRLLPFLWAIGAILYALSRLPLALLLKRCRYPSLFLIGVVLFLPFFSGETVLWQLGGLSLRQEGCLAVLRIASRFGTILTLSLVLLETSSVLSLIRALSALGLSPILADMALLAYRYLFGLEEQLTRMQTAMRLRGFQPRQLSRRNLKVLAALAGSLLVLSYEQSERVYQAMVLRGYGSAAIARQQQTSRSGWGRFAAGLQQGWQELRRDRLSAIALLLSCLAATSLILAERLL